MIQTDEIGWYFVFNILRKQLFKDVCKTVKAKQLNKIMKFHIYKIEMFLFKNRKYKNNKWQT